MVTASSKQPSIRAGDFYADCLQQPMYCTEVAGDLVQGISLFDGSSPKGCSFHHCRPQKLSLEGLALRIKNRQRWIEARQASSADGTRERLISQLLAEEGAAS